MLGIAALDTILNSSSTDEQILTALSALQIENVDQTLLDSAIEAVRKTADIHEDLSIELHEVGRFSLDCSGTGGSGMSHFNTSTSTAFVLAAAGYKIAKFGGRAASGRSGSFDFLDCLGIKSTLPVHSAAEALSVCGVAFIYAPQVYPQLKRLGPLRKTFGKPTLFNYIGPLLNPLRPASRLMGISSDRARSLVAGNLLKDKMTSRAILVTAGGKLDEFAVDQMNNVSMISDGKLEEFELDVHSAPDLSLISKNGAADTTEDELDPQANFLIFNEIIQGNDTRSPHYKMLLLNAASGFLVLKACKSLAEGLSLAANLIADGSVSQRLATCRRYYAKLSD